MSELIANERLAEAMRDAYPELEEIRAAASRPAYLVGGAVRDLLLGRGRADLDLVVVGDATEPARLLASRNSAWTVVETERFGTAKARFDGHSIDIATARTETYPSPGALPEVTPTDSVEADLDRRDFTINAIAIPLDGGEPIDPHGGRGDLEAGLLRVLHPGSFVDDPTRALRAARYAARFGFEVEPETERLLRAADLETVSDDRRQAELMRLASEETAPRGFELLGEWGLVAPRPGGPALAAAVAELAARPPWAEEVDAGRAVLAAALGPVGGEEALAALRPPKPSAAVEAAAGRDPVELLLARALGAEWLDSYLTEWRPLRLEIAGEDLIAAGVAEGPAVGRGLAAALRGKLDGELSGREEELAAALAAAREA